ncbi:MAG: DNA internalization-related competence protein ComEC/Rec2 [Dehalococcoidales bacterium]|nr:DNA internalization-related competence protein ComEC/Rec2 [Dehalococcoidales bacterium]
MYLICLCCGWITGILFGSLFPLPVLLTFTGLIPFSLALVIKRHRRIAILAGLFVVTFFTGNYLYSCNISDNNDNELNFYNGRDNLQIKGIIRRDPEPGNKNTRLQVDVASIFLDEAWRNISGTALVFVPIYSDYNYGDLLLIEGSPKTPPQLEDFDYETYLARKGIYSTIFYPKITVLDTGLGIKPMEWIYAFRNELAGVMDKTLIEPQASLTKGILLGMRSTIPLSTRDEFNNTGTAHLLAISGLHLAIIAGILVSLGIRIFGRKGYVYIWMTIAAIWMYAILTGMNPPVLRSVQMISLFFAAELFGRQRSSIIALSFAAALMSGFNPQVLWDPSFQLSFTAMTGLVFIFPLLQSLSRRVIISRFGETGIVTGITSATADSFSVSLSALAVVWPLVAYYFGIISPVAPVATFFTLPALPGVIVTGFLSGVTGLIFLPVAQVIAWITWFFTSYVLLVVKAFSFIPAIENHDIGILPVMLYYAVLVLLLWFIYRRKVNTDISVPTAGFISLVPKKWIVIPLLVLTVFTSVFACSMPDGKLHVYFLDVGQGDAILVCQGSRQILVDGGPSPQAIMTALGKEMPFWDRTIDMVVLTHPDADHVTGLIEVLCRYEVKQVLYPDIEVYSGLYTEFLGLIEEKDISTVLAEAGQHIGLTKDVFLDVLNPVQDIQYTDMDNNSVVLRLESGTISYLLTGDIMKEGEYTLLSRRAVKECTVLKLGHHGSASSTTSEFLSAVNPQIAIISAGKDNRYGHPDEEVMERLKMKGNIAIFNTGIHGTIEFISDDNDVWVKTEK